MTAGELKGREAVAACTLAAAHRRDHHHETGCCVPHRTEVVHLGTQAAMVCHDCGTDSGFIEPRAADTLAREHVDGTRAGTAA